MLGVRASMLIASLAMPFSKHEQCPLMRCALRLAAQTPGIVVDVGANGGCETNLALSHGRQVVAMECLAASYWELLQESRFRTNRNLTLLHACAGSSVNASLLHLVSDSSSLMVENIDHGPEAAKAKLAMKKGGGARTESVVVVPVDQLLPPGVPISLIKIDVQGAEGAVLRGLQHTLRHYMPVVTFEYLMKHPNYRSRWKTQGNPADDIMRPLGYSCFINFVDFICLPPGHAFVTEGRAAAKAHAQAEKGAPFPCNKDRRGLYN